MPIKSDVVIIGAGPAGCIAALAAAKHGKKVLLIESQNAGLKKLAASGGRRCNISNSAPFADFIRKFGHSQDFVKYAIKEFGSSKLCRFLQSIEVPTFSPDNQHIYPQSQKAADVVSALNIALEKAFVERLFSTQIKEIRIIDGCVTGCLASTISSDKSHSIELLCDRIILASGGKGYASLGGCEDGFTLAKMAGHSIISPVPGLTGILTTDSWVKELSGLTIDDAIITEQSGKTKFRGSLLFTHHGFSGPVALDASATISRRLTEVPQVNIAINFLPEMNEEILRQRFLDWQQKFGSRFIEGLFATLLPRRLAEAQCALNGYFQPVRAAELTREKREIFLKNMLAMPVIISGTNGFDAAMVTSGGVKTLEVYPSTLKSKLIKGLSFAGEILDVDGACGGFNLQWAFSSGWVAGSFI